MRDADGRRPKRFEPTVATPYVMYDADGQPTATREINLYSEYFLETPISRSPYVNYIVVGVGIKILTQQNFFCDCSAVSGYATG